MKFCVKIGYFWSGFPTWKPSSQAGEMQNNLDTVGENDENNPLHRWEIFHVDQVRNGKTDRYITNLRVEDVPSNVRTIKRTKHLSQLMMFGLVASNGLKIPPVFLKKGFRTGVKDYLEQILQPMDPAELFTHQRWSTSVHAGWGSKSYSQDRSKVAGW